MITDDEKIQAAIDKCRESDRKYFGMSYEDGIVDALEWVLGYISDDEFEYAL
jgi:hypothetical protein